jgi:hypothetical protein
VLIRRLVAQDLPLAGVDRLAFVAEQRGISDELQCEFVTSLCRLPAGGVFDDVTVLIECGRMASASAKEELRRRV